MNLFFSLFDRQRRRAVDALLAVLFWLLLLLTQSVPAVAAGQPCPAAATAPSPEAVQAAMKGARDRGFLWQISKDGRTSYLYGTIHIAKLEWMFPGPKVMRALQMTDTVALELDLMDTDIRSRLMQGLAAAGNTTLPKSLQSRLRKQADAFCVPYESIAALSPEMQVTMLTVMAGRADGLEAAYAIDTVLAGIGHGANKHMVSLETPEAQLDMLKSDDAQEVEAFVQDSLANMESGHAGELLKHIARVWAESDYAELARYAEWCDCMNSDAEREMMKRMLDQRNPNLADGIDQLHKSGKRVFAAVGSLHMFGPFAIPALLAKRGYRVERIDFEAK